MAAMPDAAQSQYIRFLLDFLDDQTAGRNRGEFGWIHGDTTAGEGAVERLLTAGGTHFIGIGQMHLLGPDGIPAQLRSVKSPS